MGGVDAVNARHAGPSSEGGHGHWAGKGMRRGSWHAVRVGRAPVREPESWAKECVYEVPEQEDGVFEWRVLHFKAELAVVLRWPGR